MLLRRLPLSFVLPLSRLLLLVATALLSGCHGDTHCTERSEYVACVNRLEGHEDLPSDLPTTPCKDSEVKYVPMGSEETLECQVLSNVQVDFLGWHFYPSDSTRGIVMDINLNPSPSTSRFTNETDRLTILNIEPGDEGVYVCEAKEGNAQTRMVIAGCVIVHATVPSYTGGSVSLPTTRGKDVTLMTRIIFENGGFCNVTPTYSQARFRYEPNTNVLFLCQNQSCVIDDDQSFYNFSSLGDVVVRASHVMEGPYLMAIIQNCPSTVLRMTYDITFTSEPMPSASVKVSPTPTAHNVPSTVVVTPTPTEPTRADCPELNIPANGSVKLVQTLTNLVAIFSCDAGFGLVGTSYLTCESNGTWTGKLPVCKHVSESCPGSEPCDSCCPETVSPSADPCPSPTSTLPPPVPGNIVSVRRAGCGVLEWDPPVGGGQGLTYKIRFYGGQSFATTPASLRRVLASPTNSLTFTAQDVPSARPLYAIVKARNSNGVHSPSWSTAIIAAIAGCP